MRSFAPRPSLARVVFDDAPGLELGCREAVMQRIERALGEMPEKQRHYLGHALLERALLDCRRRLGRG